MWEGEISYGEPDGFGRFCNGPNAIQYLGYMSGFKAVIKGIYWNKFAVEKCGFYSNSGSDLDKPTTD